MEPVLKLLRTPYDKLTGMTRLTMENENEIRKSLKFYEDSKEAMDHDPDDDPDDDDNNDDDRDDDDDSDDNETQQESSIWSKNFQSSMKSSASLSKITKYANGFRNPLTLKDPESRLEDLEEYFGDISISLEEHARVADSDLLFALARNQEVSVPERYKHNNTAISLILRATVNKRHNSNANSTVKPHRKDGFRALQSLLEFADPDSWNSKMIAVSQLLSLKYNMAMDLEQFLIGASKMYTKCSSKNVTLEEMYLGQIIKSFDGESIFKDALTQMQTSGSEVNEERIRKTLVLVRDTQRRQSQASGTSTSLLSIQQREIESLRAMINNTQQNAQRTSSSAHRNSSNSQTRCKGCNGFHHRLDCPHRNTVCACGIVGHTTEACFNGGVPRQNAETRSNTEANSRRSSQ